MTVTTARPALVGPSLPRRPAAPRRYFQPGPRPAARAAEEHGVLGLRGLRLTQRGRVVVAVLAALVSLPVAGLGGHAFASGPDDPPEVVVHTVAPGETLWGFARGIAEPGEDLRPVVARIQVLNGLDSAALQIGQTILLPAA